MALRARADAGPVSSATAPHALAERLASRATPTSREAVLRGRAEPATARCRAAGRAVCRAR